MNVEAFVYFEARCPYCGMVQKHRIDILEHDRATVVVRCDDDDQKSEPCDRDFVVDVHRQIVAVSRKIETATEAAMTSEGRIVIS